MPHTIELEVQCASANRRGLVCYLINNYSLGNYCDFSDLAICAVREIAVITRAINY